MARQRGIALLVSLMLLLMVMLLGVSAAQLALQSEKAARSERDRDVAFAAAEDGLMNAERDIQHGSDPARRAAFDAPGESVAFADACGADAGAGGADAGGAAAAGVGLRARAASGKAPAWQQVDLSGASDGGACTAMHGAYAAGEMPTGEGFLPFKKPRYLIERMECHQPGDDASAAAPPRYCYRVTAIGFGAKPETELVLQSVFSNPEGEP